MWLVTNGIFLARREDMIQWGYLLGQKPYKFQIEKSAAIDIDDDVDYKTTKILFS